MSQRERLPVELCLVYVGVSEPDRIAAVGVHHVDLRGISPPPKSMPEMNAMRVPSGEKIGEHIEFCRVVGESCLVRAVGVHHVDVNVIIDALEHNASAIGRPFGR